MQLAIETGGERVSTQDSDAGGRDGRDRDARDRDARDRDARDRDGEFSEYMAARQQSLLRTAYLLTGDRQEAEDLVQTALAKLYLSWDRVQRRELVDGYVRRILVNEHNSLWRRAWKRRESATSELPDQPVPWVEPEGRRDRALWDFVQSLPRKQRAVVVLRYYEELSEAETAHVLGVSVGTVKSQSSRALASLRARVHDVPELAGDHDAPAGDRVRTSAEEDR